MLREKQGKNKLVHVQYRCKFSLQYVWSVVGWIHRCETHRYSGLTAYVLIYYLPPLFIMMLSFACFIWARSLGPKTALSAQYYLFNKQSPEELTLHSSSLSEGPDLGRAHKFRTRKIRFYRILFFFLSLFLFALALRMLKSVVFQLWKVLASWIFICQSSQFSLYFTTHVSLLSIYLSIHLSISLVHFLFTLSFCLNYVLYVLSFYPQ